MNGSEVQDYSILQSGVENLEVLLPVYQDFLRYYHGRYGHRLRDIPLTSSGIREYLLEQFERVGAVVFLAVSDLASGGYCRVYAALQGAFKPERIRVLANQGPVCFTGEARFRIGDSPGPGGLPVLRA